ncbi:hypothetical protein HDE_12938 [Halotydeus destructor]|nr:hypothetical protein HDE_12938 [Halotydeus destructor]
MNVFNRNRFSIGSPALLLHTLRATSDQVQQSFNRKSQMIKYERNTLTEDHCFEKLLAVVYVHTSRDLRKLYLFIRPLPHIDAVYGGQNSVFMFTKDNKKHIPVSRLHALCTAADMLLLYSKPHSNNNLEILFQLLSNLYGKRILSTVKAFRGTTHNTFTMKNLAAQYNLSFCPQSSFHRSGIGMNGNKSPFFRVCFEAPKQAYLKESNQQREVTLSDVSSCLLLGEQIPHGSGRY